MSRSAVSAEHLPVAAHLALVSLPSMPSNTRFSTSAVYEAVHRVVFHPRKPHESSAEPVVS